MFQSFPTLRLEEEPSAIGSRNSTGSWKRIGHYLSLGDHGATRIGREVFAMGYPAQNILGSDVKFSEGTISSLSGFQGDAVTLQISVPIQPGNSGGPLVDEEGAVLGVISSMVRPEYFYQQQGTLPQSINYAIKSIYAEPLFEAPPTRPPTKSREEAIQRVTDSICAVLADRY